MFTPLRAGAAVCWEGMDCSGSNVSPSYTSYNNIGSGYSYASYNNINPAPAVTAVTDDTDASTFFRNKIL